MASRPEQRPTFVYHMSFGIVLFHVVRAMPVKLHELTRYTVTDYRPSSELCGRPEPSTK